MIEELLSRHRPAESIKQQLDREPDVIALDEEAAQDVISALSSATARSMLTVLYQQPRTASELADEVDTTLQNVSYHLDNLRDAGLIEPVDTWYSDRGTEMKVYAPTNTALVLFVGEEADRTSLRQILKRLLSLGGIVAVMSVLIGRAVREWMTRPDLHFMNPKSPAEEPVPADQALFPLPPEVLVFLGSLLGLLVMSAWWYYRGI